MLEESKGRDDCRDIGDGSQANSDRSHFRESSDMVGLMPATRTIKVAS